jgi:ADP-ribose pyrophosphatase YjhB (NUDIX family)
MFSRKSADATTRIGLGVGVFVVDSGGRILLERRSDCGMWGLLGGRVEAGESVAEAAVREVFEESGLRTAVTRLIGVYSEPLDRIVVYPDNGDRVHKIDIIIQAKIITGTLTRSEESEELRFFDPQSIPPESEICPPARQPIADFVQGHGQVLR